jgi:hypothetical protein
VWIPSTLVEMLLSGDNIKVAKGLGE